MRRSLLISIIVVLAAACTAVPAAPPQSVGLPVVSISAPAPGANVPVGSVVPVVVVASDTVGVSRVELAAGGVVVDSYTAPQPAGQPSVSAQLTWTPSAEGPQVLSVTAYRADGTASAPASVAVSVATSGEPGASAETPTSPPDAGPAPSDPPPVDPGEEPPVTATDQPPVAPPPTDAPPTDAPPTGAPPTDARSAPALADIYVTDLLVVQETPHSVSVIAYYVNQGTVEAPAFVVRATCRGLVAEVVTPGPLAVGAEGNATVRFSREVDPGTTPDRSVVITADATGLVAESNEGNNGITTADALCAE